MEETQQSKLGELEALLFVHGEPIAPKKIAAMMGVSEGEASVLLKLYEDHLQGEERGLALLRDGEKVQLVTKPQWGALLEAFVKDELKENLTPAALETLSIVLYCGPIDRNRIEYLRGVNSLFTLRTLRIRGLVERIPDPARPQSFLYSPSVDVLRHLGVTKQDELPEFEKFKALLEQGPEEARADELEHHEGQSHHVGDNA